MLQISVKVKELDMQVNNNVNFGSTFVVNPRRMANIGKKNQQKLGLVLRRYAAVGERQLQDLFSGRTSSLKVSDANDTVVNGFLKAFRVKAEKI